MSTTTVCGAEGAVVMYAPSAGAVGLLPFAFMSTHTMARISAAVAKVCSKLNSTDLKCDLRLRQSR